MSLEKRLPLSTRALDEIVAFRADGPVALAQLLAESADLARRLPRQAYTVNLQTDRYRYLLGFCATLLSGGCTLMPADRLQVTLSQLATEYPGCHVLGENAPEFDGLQSNTRADAIPAIPADQQAVIAFTSGSTGKPRPNIKYWETLLTGTANNVDLLAVGAPEDSSQPRVNFVATVPCQHMWGLETVILLPLLSRVAACHRSPFYPQDIADALASLPGPRALVSSPIHLEALARAEVELPPLHCVYSATAPLLPEQAGLLEEAFNAPLIDVFGFSEAGIIASRRASSDDLWRIGPKLTISAAAQGYEINGSHLAGAVPMPDRIEQAGPDHFRWLGRNQDMIKIAGKRGSLADLNRKLLSIDGVIDGVIFAPSDNCRRLAALVVTDGLSTSAVIEPLRREIDAVFMPRPVFRVPRLPRQETGKLSRSATLELFENCRAKQSGAA